MAKERALTLESLRVMDAIDRRGSFGDFCGADHDAGSASFPLRRDVI